MVIIKGCRVFSSFFFFCFLIFFPFWDVYMRVYACIYMYVCLCICVCMYICVYIYICVLFMSDIFVIVLC